MPALLRLAVHNYRCLGRVDHAAREMNVLFGPNGVGKTTFLDALWFLRDCAIRGTEESASSRHHGIGALADNVGDGDEQIRITVETNAATYQIVFGYSAGRIEAFVGETLHSKTRNIELIRRSVGSGQAYLYHEKMDQVVLVKLRDPEKLAFSNYLLFTDAREEVNEIDSLLRSLHLYASRAINLHQLRRYGSESGVHTYPWDRWQNLWSALRNLNDRRSHDDRFDIILKYMRRAFPRSFKDILFEQVGNDRVGASFIERGRRSPIQASGVSDGHLQMLGLLTCLFGDIPERSSLLLFDEPETSLHPHAIATFAQAATEAVIERNRQVFIATHSPVLISQFDPHHVFLAERGEDCFTTLRPVSEIGDLKELAEHYALGSLYMAEQVGSQSGDLTRIDGNTTPSVGDGSE
jgi:predicted ATPase